jgi:hypothetical protein
VEWLAGRSSALNKPLLDIQIRICRQRLSSRNARSSWFTYTVAMLVTKAASTSETPEPAPKPLHAAETPQNELPEGIRTQYSIQSNTLARRSFA